MESPHTLGLPSTAGFPLLSGKAGNDSLTSWDDRLRHSDIPIHDTSDDTILAPRPLQFTPGGSEKQQQRVHRSSVTGQVMPKKLSLSMSKFRRFNGLDSYKNSPVMNPHVTLYSHGTSAFEAILHAIDHAQIEVLYESYNFQFDQIGSQVFQKLVAAANRGVYVVLLYDVFGSNNYDMSKFEPLIRAGGRVVAFNPILKPWEWKRTPFFRNHRKSTIIDGIVGFTGGMNTTDEYVSGTGDHGSTFKDFHTRIVGPSALEMRKVFFDSLSESSSRTLLHELPPNTQLLEMLLRIEHYKPFLQRCGEHRQYTSRDWVATSWWGEFIKIGMTSTKARLLGLFASLQNIDEDVDDIQGIKATKRRAMKRPNMRWIKSKRQKSFQVMSPATQGGKVATEGVSSNTIDELMLFPPQRDYILNMDRHRRKQQQRLERIRGSSDAYYNLALPVDRLAKSGIPPAHDAATAAEALFGWSAIKQAPPDTALRISKLSLRVIRESARRLRTSRGLYAEQMRSLLTNAYMTLSKAKRQSRFRIQALALRHAIAESKVDLYGFDASIDLKRTKVSENNNPSTTTATTATTTATATATPNASHGTTPYSFDPSLASTITTMDLKRLFQRTYEQIVLPDDTNALHAIHFNNVPAQVLSSNVWTNTQRIQQYYQRAISNATQTIYITNPYVLPPPWLKTALLGAADRGIQVYLLLSGQGANDVPQVRLASLHVYHEYLQHGVRVFEFSQRTLHAKVMVVDERHSCVGSFNLDPYSIGVNLETTMVIPHNASFAQSLIANTLREIALPTTVEITKETLKQWSPLWRNTVHLAFIISKIVYGVANIRPMQLLYRLYTLLFGNKRLQDLKFGIPAYFHPKNHHQQQQQQQSISSDDTSPPTTTTTTTKHPVKAVTNLFHSADKQNEGIPKSNVHLLRSFGLGRPNIPHRPSRYLSKHLRHEQLLKRMVRITSPPSSIIIGEGLPTREQGRIAKTVAVLKQYRPIIRNRGTLQGRRPLRLPRPRVRADHINSSQSSAFSSRAHHPYHPLIDNVAEDINDHIDSIERTHPTWTQTTPTTSWTPTDVLLGHHHHQNHNSYKVLEPSLTSCRPRTHSTSSRPVHTPTMICRRSSSLTVPPTHSISSAATAMTSLAHRVGTTMAHGSSRRHHASHARELQSNQAIKNNNNNKNNKMHRMTARRCK